MTNLSCLYLFVSQITLNTLQPPLAGALSIKHIGVTNQKQMLHILTYG